jgi:hypothetical protein
LFLRLMVGAYQSINSRPINRGIFRLPPLPIAPQTRKSIQAPSAIQPKTAAICLISKG